MSIPQSAVCLMNSTVLYADSRPQPATIVLPFALVRQTAVRIFSDSSSVSPWYSPLLPNGMNPFRSVSLYFSMFSFRRPINTFSSSSNGVMIGANTPLSMSELTIITTLSAVCPAVCAAQRGGVPLEVMP